MFKRTCKWFVAVAVTLASEGAFAISSNGDTVLVGGLVSTPGGISIIGYSSGNLAGTQNGLLNNGAITNASVNGGSSWIGTLNAGLLNNGTIGGTTGFHISSGSTLYGAGAGILTRLVQPSRRLETIPS